MRLLLLLLCGCEGGERDLKNKNEKFHSVPHSYFFKYYILNIFHLLDVEIKANGGRLDIEKSAGGGLDDVDPSILIQMIEKAESEFENDESYRKIARAMEQMVSFTSKEKLTPADFSNHVLKVDSRCKRNKFSEDEFSLMRYIKNVEYSRIKTDGKSIHWESFLKQYETLAKKIDKYYSSCDTLGEISLYQRDKDILKSRAKMYFKTLRGK